MRARSLVPFVISLQLGLSMSGCGGQAELWTSGQVGQVGGEIRTCNPRKGPCPDLTVPSISISSPLAESIIAGVVEIVGTAADNVAISKVELSVSSGPFQLATGTTSWRFILDTRAYSNGRQVLTARVTDTSGNSSSKSLTLTVQNSESVPPAVAISSPTIDQTMLIGSTTVAGSASDNVKLAKVEVSIDSQPFELATGTTTWSRTLDLRGWSVGGHTLVAKATDSSGNTSYASVRFNLSRTVAQGEAKTLVMMINFQDRPTDRPWTHADINNYFFGSGTQSINGFLKESSYGKHWLSGDVVGWYTLSLDSATATGHTIMPAADAAAQAAGIDLSKYSHIFYACASVTWDNGGFWGGDSSVRGVIGIIPRSLWSTAHEIGHMYGLLHSNALANTTTMDASGAVSLIPPSTAVPRRLEYADQFDVMGSGNRFDDIAQNHSAYHYNAAQKERVGWLTTQTTPALTAVSTGGTYFLEPFETATAGPKGLKILRSTDPVTGQKIWYYVEYRRGIGFDGTMGSLVGSGLLIHVAGEGWPDSPNADRIINLLDMTPNINTSSSSNHDPALPLNTNFIDREAGITIVARGANDAGAHVEVVIGPPAVSGVRRHPTITLSPRYSPEVAAGTRFDYVVTLTNHDDAAVGPSRYALKANMAWWGDLILPDWQMTFASAFVTVAPGSTASTTLQVTSPTSAVAGYNQIWVDATNLSVPLHWTRMEGAYIISP